ncbi:TPA: hypothetical protein RG419_003582 [Morganella morganii]|nr:hypothetical protein [Morganella morganii]
MQPHQQRVVDEKAELDDKISKLTVFTGGDIFKSIHQEDQDLLIDQLSLMAKYSQVLQKRISRF